MKYWNSVPCTAHTRIPFFVITILELHYNNFIFRVNDPFSSCTSYFLFKFHNSEIEWSTWRSVLGCSYCQKIWSHLTTLTNGQGLGLYWKIIHLRPILVIDRKLSCHIIGKCQFSIHTQSTPFYLATLRAMKSLKWNALLNSWHKNIITVEISYYKREKAEVY